PLDLSARPLPRSSPFPYTTLFRSRRPRDVAAARERRRRCARARRAGPRRRRARRRGARRLRGEARGRRSRRCVRARRRTDTNPGEPPVTTTTDAPPFPQHIVGLWTLASSMLHGGDEMLGTTKLFRTKG